MNMNDGGTWPRISYDHYMEIDTRETEVETYYFLALQLSTLRYVPKGRDAAEALVSLARLRDIEIEFPEGNVKPIVRDLQR